MHSSTIINERDPSKNQYAADFERAFGRPTWFGPSDSPLFGWHHMASEPQRSVAAVICAPFGHEYMVVHRSLRKLGALMASHGFHTLRFDYHGTGDSTGLASDPGRLEAWIQSTCHAVTEVRRASRCDQVMLIGLRLGATIAALASKRCRVDGLIMLSPVINGRKYTRELVAFAGMKNVATDNSGHTVISEVVGYPLTDETKHELSKIDLSYPGSCRVNQCLLVSRADLPSSENKLAASLTADGVTTKTIEDSGFASLLTDDAYDAQVPEELWTKVASWACGTYPDFQTALPITPTAMTSKVTFVSQGQEISERVFVLHGVTAILTTAITEPDHNLPTILISNTGANHRVGNHRLCVTMARTWCALGFRVIRYDRPGTGDSLNPPGSSENDIYATSGVGALVSLMNFCEQDHGAPSFILAGLCSGAYFSYQTALLDRRAQGLLMINPLTYHWREGDSVARPERRSTYKSTRFYLAAATRPSTWRRLLRREIDFGGIASTLGSRVLQRATHQWRASLAWALRHEPSVSPIGQSFLDLEGRGVTIFMIFDAAEGGIDLMEEHMHKNAGLMRQRPLFRLEIIPGADHTFTPLWSQSHLVTMIADHLHHRFGR
ncbi:MAG: alpha/beta fold hydrolase [Deltaproteobacteria bacterium]|nr:alpha/beta fold hydrolase [Deltaproteobacteria bacterium]